MEMFLVPEIHLEESYFDHIGIRDDLIYKNI